MVAAVVTIAVAVARVIIVVVITAVDRPELEAAILLVVLFGDAEDEAMAHAVLVDASGAEHPAIEGRRHRQVHAHREGDARRIPRGVARRAVDRCRTDREAGTARGGAGHR